MTTDRPTPDLVPQIVQWALTRDAIRAALLTSTRAISDAQLDVLSDYDVILIVRAIQPWVTDRAWITDFGEVLIAYWNPIAPAPDFGIEYCLKCGTEKTRPPPGWNRQAG